MSDYAKLVYALEQKAQSQTEKVRTKAANMLLRLKVSGSLGKYDRKWALKPEDLPSKFEKGPHSFIGMITGLKTEYWESRGYYGPSTNSAIKATVEIPQGKVSASISASDWLRYSGFTEKSFFGLEIPVFVRGSVKPVSEDFAFLNRTTVFVPFHVNAVKEMLCNDDSPNAWEDWAKEEICEVLQDIPHKNTSVQQYYLPTRKRKGEEIVIPFYERQYRGGVDIDLCVLRDRKGDTTKLWDTLVEESGRDSKVVSEFFNGVFKVTDGDRTEYHFFNAPTNPDEAIL